MIFIGMVISMLFFLWIFSSEDENTKEKVEENLKELLLKINNEQKSWLLEYMVARGSGDKQKEQEAFENFVQKFDDLEKEITDFDYKKDYDEKTKKVKPKKTKKKISDLEKELNEIKLQDKNTKEMNGDSETIKPKKTLKDIL